MMILELSLVSLGLLMILQTTLSFMRSRAWWVRITDFPRPQIAFFSLILLGLLGVINLGAESVTRWEWMLLVLLGVSVVVQVVQMLPYTWIWKPQVPAAPKDHPRADRLRIIASNVCMDNREVGRWLDTIRRENPDVIVAVEVDAWWSQQLRVLHEDYAHRILQPQDNTYGMAIYSRVPLRDTVIEHLVEPDVPSIFTTVELASGRHVRCVALHPRPPRPDIAQDSDLRDAELARAAKIIRPFRAPTIVVGDLNDVAWSHTTHLFQRIARVLDPRIGRGLFATFHADHRFLRYPLDHVFHTNHFDVVEIRRLGHVGSDHFPILIELALRAEQVNRPDVDPMNPADQRQAAEAIEDARELKREETSEENRERKSSDR